MVKSYKNISKVERRIRKSWIGRKAVELRKNSTKYERMFRSLLLDAGFYRHRFQQTFDLEEGIYIADFLINRLNIIVEIDGGYHYNDEQVLKDIDREKHLMSVNWINGMLRISN